MGACPFSKKEPACPWERKKEIGKCDRCHFLRYYLSRGVDVGIVWFLLLGCTKQAGVRVGMLLDVYPEFSAGEEVAQIGRSTVRNCELFDIDSTTILIS